MLSHGLPFHYILSLDKMESDYNDNVWCTGKTQFKTCYNITQLQYKEKYYEKYVCEFEHFNFYHDSSNQIYRLAYALSVNVTNEARTKDTHYIQHSVEWKGKCLSFPLFTSGSLNTEYYERQNCVNTKTLTPYTECGAIFFSSIRRIFSRITLIFWSC